MYAYEGFGALAGFEVLECTGGFKNHYDSETKQFEQWRSNSQPSSRSMAESPRSSSKQHTFNHIKVALQFKG